MKRYFRIAMVAMALVIASAWTLNKGGDKYFEIIKNIEIFTNLYKEVNTYYVEDIEPGQLMRTGLDAMVGSLDPFTNYISESDIESYRYIVEGRYNGIGAKSRLMNGYVTITDLYKDQPADKAGLRPGDQIIAVEDKDAANRTVEELDAILKGFPGTAITLTIRRPGVVADFDVNLVRGQVEVDNIPYYGMLRDNIGYINLSQFSRDAGPNVAKAFKELKKENAGMKGIVLDLRGNGGGLLHEAVNLCNIWIPKDELVVSTRGKVKEWDRSYKTRNAPIDLEMPVAVLVNKRSASASEIVSGVLQDYDRGILIGQRTYGKGLVQNTMDIGYNAKVKITTAKYYIPSQRCIQSVEYKDGEPVNIPDEKRTVFKTRAGRQVLDGGGVKPDVVIEKAEDGGIVESLIEQHMIFDFVTTFAQNKKEIAAVEDFQFNDFAAFESFLEENNFVYESDSEKLLQKLEDEAKEEGLDLSADIDRLEQQVNDSQKQELRKYQQEILKMIEKEIAGRYYYERGKVQMGLRNDAEIAEAISILNDPARYKKILSIQ